METRDAQLPRRPLALALLFVGLALTGAAAQWKTLAPKQRIGIDVGAPVILRSLPSPSLTKLASLGFTDVGTNPEPQWLLNLTVQQILHQWIDAAHRNGLRTFALIGEPEFALRLADLAPVPCNILSISMILYTCFRQEDQ